MEGSSIGIIGGADGPTTILVSGNPVRELIAALAIVVLAAAIIVGAIVIRRKKK